MITVDVGIKDDISKELAKVQRQMKQVPAEAYNEFVDLTPIRTGNARRRTRLSGGDTIVADYPYAERLDNGWSRQAPRGMTEPLQKWLERRIKSILGR